MTVQITITIATISFIERIITKRSIDDIHPHTVCKLNGSCPIIFFYRLFGIIILATKQPIRSFRCSSYKYILDIGCHTRKHLHPVRVFFIYVRIRIDKVMDSQQIHMFEKLDFISIVETGINHRHMHTFTCKTSRMKAVPSMDLNLTKSFSIRISGFLPVIGYFFLALFVACRNAIGLRPYLLNIRHERHFLHLIHQCRIRHFEYHRIIPLTRSNQFSTGSQQFLYIGLTHRQIGFIHR